MDVSFNNSSYSDEGRVRYYDPGGSPRVLYGTSDSEDGDPLGWSGDAADPVTTQNIPNVRVFIQKIGYMAPGTTGNFTEGAWTGEVMVFQEGQNVQLRANDDQGNGGISNPILVEPGVKPLTGAPPAWILYE